MVSAGQILNVSMTYRPAIDGQVAVAVGLVGAGVGDGPGGTSRPTLASNEVTLVVAPPHVEVAAVTVGVGSIALAARRREYVSKRPLLIFPESRSCTNPSVQ